MSDKINIKISEEIGEILRKEGKSVATAESCTGGNIAATIVAVSGSSEYFKGGIVAYSNDVKISLLHVSKNTLDTDGAVSEKTVVEMVKGAMETLETDFAVATSGIAGPGGGSEEKPVGTVWIAVGCKTRIITFKQETDDGREENIRRATQNALNLLYKLLKGF